MAVFSLPCSSRGKSVDISGRYGFKFKNAGITDSVCRTYLQGAFLASHRDNISSQIATAARPDQRRLIHFTTAVVALALLIGGVVTRSVFPTTQEALPVSESPFK